MKSEISFDSVAIAENSSGHQELHITVHKIDNEASMTVTGHYEGKIIQLDFNSMSKSEFKRFAGKVFQALSKLD